MTTPEQQTILRDHGLLTPEQAAAELRISPATVRDYVRRQDRDLQGRRMFGRVFIHQSEVVRYRESPRTVGRKRRVTRDL